MCPPNCPLFTCQEWDSFAGLYYYDARWYDSVTGRFWSQDPKEFGADDANLYRYVGNDPTDKTDPRGLDDFGFRSPPAVSWDPGWHPEPPCPKCGATDTTNTKYWDLYFSGMGADGKPLWADQLVGGKSSEGDAIQRCQNANVTCPPGYNWLCTGIVGGFPVGNRGNSNIRVPVIYSQATGACVKCEGSCPAGEVCGVTSSFTVWDQLGCGIPRKQLFEECKCGTHD